MNLKKLISGYIFPENLRIPFVIDIAKLWIKSGGHNLNRVASWALKNLLIPSISKNEISKIQKLRTTIQEKSQKPNYEYDKIVSIYLGTIIGEKFERKDVEETLTNNMSGMNHSLFAKALGINLNKD